MRNQLIRDGGKHRLIARIERLKKKNAELLRLLHNCTLNPGDNKQFWNAVKIYLDKELGLDEPEPEQKPNVFTVNDLEEVIKWLNGIQ